MKINLYITELLIENNIPTASGLLYLLSIYYNIPADDVIDDTIIKKVNLLKIANRDYVKNTISWRIPLFEAPVVETEKSWQWVLTEYRELWMQIAPSKGGDQSGCIDKMKKFFANNPEIRKEDVMRAAYHYTESFKTVNNPKYMIQADYFISKKVEGTFTSKLKSVMDELETITEKKTETEDRYHGKIK